MEHKVLGAKSSDYWTSPNGITRRIDSLAQNFNYMIVNNAWTVIAFTNKVLWMKWMTMGDDRVCDLCYTYASGGQGGLYSVTGFTPEMPVHGGCRCQWEMWFEEPFLLII